MHEPYDEDRDALALALVEACVDKGIPIFGVCRGFQEMNVAYGGTLHPEIRDLPGRMNHRMSLRVEYLNFGNNNDVVGDFGILRAGLNFRFGN